MPDGGGGDVFFTVTNRTGNMYRTPQRCSATCAGQCAMAIWQTWRRRPVRLQHIQSPPSKCITCSNSATVRRPAQLGLLARRSFPNADIPLALLCRQAAMSLSFRFHRAQEKYSRTKRKLPEDYPILYTLSKNRRLPSVSPTLLQVGTHSPCVRPRPLSPLHIGSACT